MPLIQIHMLEGRSEEKISKLIKEVTETVVNTIDVKHEQVRVIVNEIPPSHWGTAGITKKEQAKQQ